MTTSAFFVIATPVFADELRGEKLVAALNGKSFECSTSNGRFSWRFQKSNPSGSVFPYTVKFSGQTLDGAYKLDKKGRAKHQQSNKSRKIVQNANGSLTVTGNGIPRAICKPA